MGRGDLSELSAHLRLLTSAGGHLAVPARG